MKPEQILTASRDKGRFFSSGEDKPVSQEKQPDTNAEDGSLLDDVENLKTENDKGLQGKFGKVGRRGPTGM